MGRDLVTLPRWLGRLIYFFRGKRKARLHLLAPGVEETLEGVLVGRWAGHYVVILPKSIASTGASISLEGYLEIPAEKVAYVQILS